MGQRQEILFSFAETEKLTNLRRRKIPKRQRPKILKGFQDPSLKGQYPKKAFQLVVGNCQ
jgi:hypothetical protein